MAQITAAVVKQLRAKTNAGMMDCKNALKETDGDLDKAIEILRKRGVSLAAKKSGRVTNQGLIDSYIHLGNKVGVLIEVNCETDFVARNESFKLFVRDLLLQVASVAPLYVSRDQVEPDVVKKEKEIAREQVKGKPENIIERIVEGKLNKYYGQVCLLEQSFVKDNTITIQDLLRTKIAELGENIVINRFIRYQLGEEI